MPEGDTVYRHAEEFRATLLGDAVAHVLVKGLEQPGLRGKTVESVEARGKHLLVGFAGGVTLRDPSYLPAGEGVFLAARGVGLTHDEL